MVHVLATALFVMCLAVPVWAAETDTFDPDQPFKQALTTSLLRSLLNQALDRLEDHVEITGHLNPDASKDNKDRLFRFKFYPEGKSKSDQHLTAEGLFRFSPEAGQHDWHFTFKPPHDSVKKLPLQSDAPL
ncbi:hypothetical protein [Candidatus Nitrospira nitrificans]|uniref:Uncharacterized protein n=1 Tax=Candidatus Nitrospira nitrificans TaxID=1742973 RepID=A0A0S4L921_9BACT|nr:hypothetical protein [Candidatus Nitrospira nitrificans]CUS31618.1 conserved exported hypothetical protein [Candidatus Nitrospira nitrificans]